MSNSTKDSAGQLRKQQTRVAWRVFLKRPLAIWVLTALVPLLMIPIFGWFEEGRLRNNVPSYTRNGKRLTEESEFRRYLESGLPDTSVVGLRLSRFEPSDEVGCGELLRLFPKLKWVQCSHEQLRDTSPDVFEELTELTTIELLTSRLEAADIERLTQIHSLEHIELCAWRSEADLTLLKNLPNLKTLHIQDFGSDDDRIKAPVLTRQHLRELAQISTIEELSLGSSTILTDTVPAGDELTEAESKAIAEFAEALSSSNQLRRVYIGDQQSGTARQALRELRSALPNVDIRPASYINEFWEKLTFSVFASIFALGVVIVHYISCSTLPQTVIVPNCLAANTRVILRIMLLVLAAQAFFLLLALKADILAAFAVGFAGLAVTVAVLDMSLLTYDDARARNVFPSVALILLFVASVFLAMVYVDRVEWFLFGEQPGIALTMILLSTILVYRVSRRVQIHRLWAEKGIAPAAAMQPFMSNLVGRNLQIMEALNEKMDTTAQQDIWHLRMKRLIEQVYEKPLKKRIASMSSGEVSLFRRLQFWSIGSMQFSLWQGLLNIAFFMPFTFAIMIGGIYLIQGTIVIPAPEQIALVVGVLLLMDVGVVAYNLYARFPMFATEVLRPITRNTWREHVLLSTLAVMMIRNCWTCLVYYVIPLAFTGNLDLIWLAVSLFAAIVFSIFAAGLTIWLVIVRRVLFSTLWAGLVFAAVVLVEITLSEGLSLDGFVSPILSTPDFWVRIVGGQLLVGLIIFSTAWRRWTKIELVA